MITINIPPIVTIEHSIKVGANVVGMKTIVDFTNIHPNSHETVLKACLLNLGIL